MQNVWSDVEADEDFLNFKTVAETAASIIEDSKGVPLSMGICGSWGVGKSSMVNLVEKSLRAQAGDTSYLFVRYNAWLYQGFDDARAALLEVIARTLLEHQKETKKPLDKAKDFLERIDLWRCVGLFASSAVSVAAGLPPVGAISEVMRTGKALFQGQASVEDVTEGEKLIKGVVDEGKGLLRPPKVLNPPKEIQLLRDQFESVLTEANVKLVVFVDDLDRCLPATLIPTLEAIRLFLMIKNTAFVIAADDLMIRKAVAKHFDGLSLDDDLVINYFDKLIQVPIRVPPLGTQDIRAYLFSLYLENREIPDDVRTRARTLVSNMLKETWKGTRIDRDKVIKSLGDCPRGLESQLELADRIAPLMSSSAKISGNPRLIKRFLNTLSIRQKIARSEGITVEEATLAKILLFERCCSASSFNHLVRRVNSSESGVVEELAILEAEAQEGKGENLPEPWKKDSEFVIEWLTLSPPLAGIDLRAAVYVSRDTHPLMTAADVMSRDARMIGEGLLKLKSKCPAALLARYSALGQLDKTLILDSVISKAKGVSNWGTPPELHALLAIAKALPEASDRIISLFLSLPPTSFKPNIVPLLQDHPISAKLIPAIVKLPGIPLPFKTAIEKQ